MSDIRMLAVAATDTGREDAALREHLLALNLQQAADSAVPGVIINNALPSWFTALLTTDTLLRQLYRGEGRTIGDISSSG